MTRPQDPETVLGVSSDAGDEEVRAAYLRAVRDHPPDRDPEGFERVRDAYQILRDPRRRLEHRLFSGDPEAPFASLLPATAPRSFAGTKPWLAALEEASCGRD